MLYNKTEVRPMYYGMITVSVLLFGGNFAFNRFYQKGMGSGFFPSFFLSFLGAAIGIVVLFPMNGFQFFDLKWFPIALAMATAVNNLTLSFCGLKTLGKVNLSLYSLFLMLGGMVLPSVLGVIFFEEPMTFAKGVCYVFLLGALLMTVEKSETKGGFLYYAGVFLLNGMSGVFAKIYQSSSLPKIPTSAYSLLCACCVFLLGGLLSLITYPRFRKKIPLLPTVFGLGGGALNQVANYLLLVALLHVPASVQYPMVTGGVMIISTVIACFTSDKPTKKQWIAVGLSFVGILLLVTIPI